MNTADIAHSCGNVTIVVLQLKVHFCSEMCFHLYRSNHYTITLTFQRNVHHVRIFCIEYILLVLLWYNIYSRIVCYSLIPRLHLAFHIQKLGGAWGRSQQIRIIELTLYAHIFFYLWMLRIVKARTPVLGLSYSSTPCNSYVHFVQKLPCVMGM